MIIWSADYGRVEMSRTGDVILVVMRGSVSNEAGELTYQALTTRLKDGPAETWFDFWNLEAYRPAVRLRCTAALLENKTQIKAVHVCMRNRVVAMGVAVALLATGLQAQTHANQKAFSAAFNARTGLTL